MAGKLSEEKRREANMKRTITLARKMWEELENIDEENGVNDLGPDDFIPKSHQHFAARLEAGFELVEAHDEQPKWWTHRR